MISLGSHFILVPLAGWVPSITVTPERALQSHQDTDKEGLSQSFFDSPFTMPTSLLISQWVPCPAPIALTLFTLTYQIYYLTTARATFSFYLMAHCTISPRRLFSQADPHTGKENAIKGFKQHPHPPSSSSLKCIFCGLLQNTTTLHQPGHQNTDLHTQSFPYPTPCYLASPNHWAHTYNLPVESFCNPKLEALWGKGCFEWILLVHMAYMIV